MANRLSANFKNFNNSCSGQSNKTFWPSFTPILPEVRPNVLQHWALGVLLGVEVRQNVSEHWALGVLLGVEVRPNVSEHWALGTLLGVILINIGLTPSSSY